jgi:hypothetical protein
MRSLFSLGAVTLLVVATAGRAEEPAGAGAIVGGKDEEAVTQIMRSFTKAMGKKCNYCHVRSEGKFEYKKWTKRKRIALWMYTHFVQKLKDSDGNPVTCGTCHPGKAKFLRAVAK